MHKSITVSIQKYRNQFTEVTGFYSGISCGHESYYPTSINARFIIFICWLCRTGRLDLGRGFVNIVPVESLATINAKYHILSWIY